jgi:hypothetical protein
MSTDWSPLRRELAAWRAAGLDLPIWWRDDDAITSTPALDRLERLAEKLTLPVHLAIIPARADASLAESVRASRHLFAMVHGWAHENHAARDRKKAEFGAPRPQAASEITEALTRLGTMLDGDVLPVFVPPWNRLHADLLGPIAQAGYRAVSIFGARAKPYPHPGLRAVNTHVDPVDWKGTGGLIDPEQLIPHIAELLRDRRTGRADRTEPFGYLTHHLVHDPDLWRFSEAFLKELLNGGARRQDIGTFLETTT